jgi:putative hydrolase of the HAD superfamily
MARGDQFDVIGFDADDTLWRSEDYFTESEQLFVSKVGPYAPTGVDVLDALRATELGNIAISGYGVKAYALSMVQAAVTSTRGEVPSSVIGELVDHVHEILIRPVELLEGVPETLAAVGNTHRLILITKGDLVHQFRKVRTSGLEHHFEHIEIVLEKDVEMYSRVLREHLIDPTRFLMVGNSIKSDILPVLELGGHGAHIPYHVTWSHEVVRDHNGGFTELTAIADLVPWLQSNQ